ncbi:hypothetical protein QFC19_006353 [Naganishia cerealis]|uniref:Uncharacterized protein n=1 Tax=Naganishia cerealis TaxID=610337 RepID=A0ACC2VIP7_9TREE|nr:hypothetical protein QFC19_006353 [Naganishia cerealis]
MAQNPTGKPIPEGFQPHSERGATILMPASAPDAFINPIQEFNRDLSVACIKQWSLQRESELRAKWIHKKKTGSEEARLRAYKRAFKLWSKEKEEQGDSYTEPMPILEDIKIADPAENYKCPKYTVLEALSATGLRSIRYAQELPNVGLVLANDMSPKACEAMRRNVEFNDVQAIPHEGTSEQPNTGPVARGKGRKKFQKTGVVVNEGDANTLIYSHRAEGDRVEVIDLDPYGTAAPFIDSSIQAVQDGGLVCVTCTDLAVLAGSNYPEKWWAMIFSGIDHALSFDNHGCLIVSRITVELQQRPSILMKGVRESTHEPAASEAHGQAHNSQPFGRVTQRTNANGNQVELFRFGAGPQGVGAGGCDHCGNGSLVAGPMWLGPLHSPDFCAAVVNSVDAEKDNYKTYARIKGMELPNMFYFTPSRIASFFRVECPSLTEYVSALLNGGFSVSRSHAAAGSIKTDAPESFIHDIMREWIKKHPVRKDKISEGSPALKLLNKPQQHEISFTAHPSAKQFTSKGDLVRYQLNPTPNWGPKARPTNKGKHNVGGGEGLLGVQESVAAAEVEGPVADEEVAAELGLQDEDALMEAVVDAETLIEETVEITGESSTGVKRGADSTLGNEGKKQKVQSQTLEEEEAALNA